MRKKDLSYISHIPEVSISKVGNIINIGNIINSGVHNRVYEYGENEVIKIPRRRFNFLYSQRSHLESDLATIHKHFPGLVIKTSILSSPNHSHHCVVQERVQKFVLVTPSNLHLVNQELDRLLHTNAQLSRSQKISLDFLGGQGFFSCFNTFFSKNAEPYFSNMVIVQSGTTSALKLLDSELIRLRVTSINVNEIISICLSSVSIAITYIFLKLSFKKNLY